MCRSKIGWILAAKVDFTGVFLTLFAEGRNAVSQRTLANSDCSVALVLNATLTYRNQKEDRAKRWTCTEETKVSPSFLTELPA